VKFSLHFNSQALFFCGLVLLAGTATGANLADTIDHVRNSVVAIGTVQPTRRPPARMVATGFVVANGHYVLTNAHAVPQGLDTLKNEILAVFSGDRNHTTRLRVHQVKVERIDRIHDLAVLKISGGPLPALKLADSSRVREGEMYAFTGYPIVTILGKYPVTHTGIISAITPIAIPQLSARSLSPKLIKRLRKPYRIFQLDATAYPGNSGSPVYNPETGAVIAVINKVFVKESKENVLSKPSGISYAIPIQYAVELLKKLGLNL